MSKKSKLTTKGVRDKLRSKRRLARIKQLSYHPVYKRPDEDAIRAGFDKGKGTSRTKALEG